MNDSEEIPDSEQIEPTGAEPLRRNSVSTKQIQDAALRTEWMNDSEGIPDSEQIEPTGTEALGREFWVILFVMLNSFQHFTGVEPCVNQVSYLY